MSYVLGHMEGLFKDVECNFAVSVKFKWKNVAAPKECPNPIRHPLPPLCLWPVPCLCLCGGGLVDWRQRCSGAGRAAC